MHLNELQKYLFLLPSCKIIGFVMGGSFAGLFWAVGGCEWLTPGELGDIFGRCAPKNNPMDGS
jgi:hypothetical protein